MRLPHGWERRLDGSRLRFYNHFIKEYQYTSPLVGQAPALPQHMSHWQILPPGWRKTWDNIGNTQFVFDPDASEPDRSADPELENLPSWVPDWSHWSWSDPEPFPSLVDEEPRYWASGKAREVHFASGYDPNSQTLRLTGVLFDRIVSLSRPWCPEPHLLPIDRLNNKTLQEWEALATMPVSSCPYQNSGGRYNAYWRTHIADYAGSRSATNKEKNYFEAWANRGEWDSGVSDDFKNGNKGGLQKLFERTKETQAMSRMHGYMIQKRFVKMSFNPVTNWNSFNQVVGGNKELRKRIYGASIGRAMFVTSKGYIGLAP